MKTPKPGTRVKLQLEGRLKDGKVVMETSPATPCVFTIGQDEVFPRIEETVKKLEPGDTATVTLPGEEAFGEYDKSKIVEIERKVLPARRQLEMGAVVTLNADIGEPVKGRVVGVENATVKIDTNHPLAGEDITIDLKLLEVA